MTLKLNTWYLGPVGAHHVFFIRGLSTSGNDNAKLSVFDFGPIYKRLSAALESHGLKFHPVLGLGAGPLPEIASRAAQFLAAHPVWRDESEKVHLLGHSAGGLVVRLLLPGLKRQIGGALTIATPHKGSRLAEIALSIPENYKGSHFLLRACGYNVAAKAHFFEELTPAGLARVFRRGEDTLRPNMVSRMGSIVCSAPRAEWCLPLKMFYKVKAFDDFKLPSDGFVERDSQPFGEVISEISIDHFRQVGLFAGDRRFDHLIQSTAGFFKGC